MMSRRRTLRILFACSLAATSLPLAIVSADLPFGLGSCCVVPLVAFALAMTVTSVQPIHRLWWFAFLCVSACWFLIASFLEHLIMETAVALQELTQRGIIDLSQRVIEPVALLLVLILPMALAIATGCLAGRAVTRLNRRFGRGKISTEVDSARWKLSIREMLISVVAICFFLGLAVSRMSSWQAANRQAAQLFASRFEASFNTGDVILLERPEITDVHRTLIPESNFRSFMGPGVNEYIVTCPISKDGTPSWAIWSYTCNAEHDDMIYQFAYAEAPAKDQLPTFPFPAKSYVNATWKMVDGVPK
jgi:hypothetical protein